MNARTIPAGKGERRGIARFLGETLVVLVSGVVFALIANGVSSRGLTLGRNYFPAGTLPPSTTLVPVASPTPVTNQPPTSPEQLIAARLQERGLSMIDGRRALALFHDPGFQRGQIVFIDARNESEYRQGHIPGAYEFDPYYPEKYFPVALPPCQAAEQIVVYCNGGDCDDSESAALTLRDVGIATNKLVVYGGGITEWAAQKLPVETGARNSGTLRPANP